MLERMSSTEISEWRVFFQLEQADMEARSEGGTSAGSGQKIRTMGHSGGTMVG
jgi:hypothetical protein